MMTSHLSYFLCLASASRGLLSRATSSRDQAAAALYSATVPRPSASSLMSLRRARHRPDLANTFSQSRPFRHSREGGNPVLSHTHHARCPSAWGEWRSGIKEELTQPLLRLRSRFGNRPCTANAVRGRGTAAEPLTPSAPRRTRPQAQRNPEFRTLLLTK